MTLVAAYSFDTGAVVDETGRGHPGTLFNTPTFPAGHTNLGISFASASSQYVEVTDHADFTLGSAWTIMYWAKATTTTAAMSCVTKVNSWWFGINTNNTVTHGFYKSIGGTESIAATTGTVVDGTWIHLAGRYNNVNLELVLNGTQDATFSVAAGFTMADTATPVRMGTWDGASEFYNGMLDDVRIFDAYLDDSQITTYMNTPAAVEKQSYYAYRRRATR